MTFNCKRIYIAGFHLQQQIYKRYFDTIYSFLLNHLPQDWKKQTLTENLYQIDQKQFCNKIKEDKKRICLTKAGVLQSAQLNQTQGIKAALVHTQYIARMCRQHNDANVCIISTDCIGQNLTADLVYHYLKSDFDGQAKNKIRLGIISDFEGKYLSENK